MIEISLSSLSTTNLGTLGNRTVDYSERTAEEEITTHPLLAPVKTETERYNAVVLKKIYSGMGSTVEGADLVRDNYHRSLKSIVAGYAGFTETPKGVAAATLLQVFADTGSIYGLSYADESAVLDKFDEALELPANQAHIATIGMTDEVAAAQQAHAHFKTLFLDQAAANADLRKTPSASSIRHDLENALRNYYALVSAMRDIAPWDDLYLALVELTKAAKTSTREFGT